MMCASILSYAPSNYQKHYANSSRRLVSFFRCSPRRKTCWFLSYKKPNPATLDKEQQLGTGLLKLCPGKDRNPAMAGEVHS
jgi:hypothetical protein